MTLGHLTAEALQNDPNIKLAKEALLKALSSHCHQLTTIRPPIENLKLSYQQLLQEFSKVRAGQLWYPYIGSGIGHGPLVELLDGSVKYDFISGIGPHFFGHSHPTLVEAGIDAALSNTVMQGHLQQNKEGLNLSKELIQLSGLDHCFLTTSGAMANENALKIAFQKKAPASRVLAFDHCFAGRTLTISQITDKPSYREGLPSGIAVDYLPFYDFQRPQESTNLAVSTLKKLLKRYPKQHALICVELIQGEGGIYPGTTSFFKAILDVAKEEKILIFFDEVQTFARTESLFAFQHFQLEAFADIVSIGKISQVCATLFKKELAPKPGLLSQTFTGSTSSLFSSLAILKLLKTENVFGKEGKNAQIFSAFSQKFDLLQKKHPGLISGPFGIGSMLAFTPLQGEFNQTIKVAKELFESGLITFIAGENPARIRMLVPAAVLTLPVIDHVLKIIEEVLIRVSHSTS